MSTPAPAPVPPPPPPSTEEGSYLIGINFGQQLHQVGITDQVTIDTVIRGLKDGLGGKKLEPTDQRSLQAFIHSVMEGIAQRNLKTGKDFLDKNTHEKGVTTTSSGLQYKILSAGDKKAASPALTDQVTVQYRGKLLDGTEFDSSYSRNNPTTFPVKGIIKGWQEALVLMKPGAKWQLWIPADLGYGNNPRPGIPAGSTLNFEVELVSINPAPSAPARAPGAGMPPGAGSPQAPSAPATPPAPPKPEQP